MILPLVIGFGVDSEHKKNRLPLVGWFGTTGNLRS